VSVDGQPSARSGRRADRWVNLSRRWVLGHQREISFYLTLAFGTLFAVDALVKLV
jgi:hypothetical protein